MSALPCGSKYGDTASRRSFQWSPELTGDATMVSLYVRFNLVPGRKDQFLPRINALIDAMSAEPDFVSAVLSEDAESPDVLVLFEVWNGTADQWLEVQPTRTYRAGYTNATNDLFDTKEVHFLTPICIKQRK
ncbi:putative quinol monooxygenase [Paraburkholderia guartelaensis]|nr:antibiotic biosynthesis monooxygenase [Paraburkholderia guartelaensis]